MSNYTYVKCVCPSLDSLKKIYEKFHTTQSVPTEINTPFVMRWAQSPALWRGIESIKECGATVIATKDGEGKVHKKMTTEIIHSNGAAKTEAIELALISGDLSKLSAEERLSYYNNTCESLGLNRLTKPFAYIQLNGKLTLYALRDATDQLRKIHNVSIAIVGRERIEDVYVVTARASLPDGRVDESTGAVTLGNLKGDNLANALMKAETKAKRRVTLSIVGLGILDESELETVPSAKAMPQTRKLEAPVETIAVDTSEAQAPAPEESVGPSPLDKWKERLEGATNQGELDVIALEVSTQADEETKSVVRKLYGAAKKRVKKAGEAQS